VLPSPAETDGEVVGVGADLEPGTLLAAYRGGLFPMPLRRGGDVAWWSPDPRGVIPLDALRVSHSLRRSCRRFEVRVDTEFEAVMRACADPSRPAGWIDEPFVAAYTRLHELGWAHSVEAWTRDDAGRDVLAGGLYGVAIGGLFAGESMFHRRTDASKVALVALVERLREGCARLLDVQWVTPHLESLGAVEIPRIDYLDLLRDAGAQPYQSWSV
jgi:leucyl/phenylalanyl-tRNA---protein transferase